MMAIWKHELKTGKLSLCIWSFAIAFLLAVCVLIYPEMEGQMGQISETFSQMGGFSQAFGMDKLNFGEFIGFFCVECGNVLGLGGALFAALTGIGVLSKEEKDHTVEFLLAHPVKRSGVVAQKLCAVFVQVFFLNLINVCVTVGCVAVIGESPDWEKMALLFLAYFIMQVEVASICFGLSAFLHRGGTGLGLGIAAVFYFEYYCKSDRKSAVFKVYYAVWVYGRCRDYQNRNDRGQICGRRDAVCSGKHLRCILEIY